MTTNKIYITTYLHIFKKNQAITQLDLRLFTCIFIFPINFYSNETYNADQDFSF